MDSLLMAAHDMTYALKHPHPDGPFATIGDDTITALTTLAAIFKNKLKKPLAPEITDSQLRAAENKCPAALVQPAIISPVNHNYHIRSQTEVNHTAPAIIIGYCEVAQPLSHKLVPRGFL
jgi:hypothetical protein